MSDYMFMLESHLSADQNRALAGVQQVASEAGACLFLTGGAMRDMLGGYPVRDLDFTVESDALPLARSLEKSGVARLVSTDELRHRAELVFPGPVSVELNMAHAERYGKPGSKPQVAPATIYEDLKWRDFTVNAIALSINRASRGLLLDPVNGVSDLERRELRAVSNTGFYDDPIRLLRLRRYQVRLGFAVDPRTQRQYENAREAEMTAKISPKALAEELRHIAHESQPGEVLKMLDTEGLLALFSPVLHGPKVNTAGFAKLQKLRQLVPFGVDVPSDEMALFLTVLSEPLIPKEKASFLQGLPLRPEEWEAWQKLPGRARRLEKELQSAGLQRPSQLYQALRDVPGEQVLYLLLHSGTRLVQDRLRNYLQKYLPKAQEISDQDVEAAGVPPGGSKFAKKKKAMIAALLDSRPKKVVVMPELTPPPVPAATGPAHRKQA